MRASAEQRERALAALAGTHLAAVPGLPAIEDLLVLAPPPAAVLSGLRSVCYEQHGFESGQDPAGVAALLAHLFQLRTGPFTALAAALTGCAVRVEPSGDPAGHERPLTSGEAAALGALSSCGLRGWERGGLMIAGTTIVAEVRLVLAPARLGDPEAVALIRKGVPCGTVLPGLARMWRKARPAWPADPAVLASAVLHRDGRGFGTSYERVTAGFVQRVAELAS